MKRTINMILFMIVITCLNVCSAKEISTYDGRFAFTVPSHWYAIPCPDSPYAYGILAAMSSFDRDTSVMFYHGMYMVPYDDFSQMPTEDRVIWRNEIINLFKNMMGNLGYKISVDDTEINRHGVHIAFNLEKSGIKYKSYVIGMVSKKHSFILCGTGKLNTYTEAVKVGNSLIVDGMSIWTWIHML